MPFNERQYFSDVESYSGGEFILYKNKPLNIERAQVLSLMLAYNYSRNYTRSLSRYMRERQTRIFFFLQRTDNRSHCLIYKYYLHIPDEEKSPELYVLDFNLSQHAKAAARLGGRLEEFILHSSTSCRDITGETDNSRGYNKLIL